MGGQHKAEERGQGRIARAKKEEKEEKEEEKEEEPLTASRP